MSKDPSPDASKMSSIQESLNSDGEKIIDTLPE
jgi:hypothetical protein